MPRAMMHDLLNMVAAPIVTAFAIFAASALPLEAAEIKTVRGAVIIKGNIEVGDYQKLRKLVETDEDYFIHSIILFSPGGNVAEAIKIGRLIRALNLETSIPGRDPELKDLLPSDVSKDNYMCASACFLVFVAGVQRTIYFGEEPILGVHRPSLTDDDLIALSADDAIASARQVRALIEGYLKEMDVPEKYSDLMFSVPKEQIRWIGNVDFESDLEGFIPGLKDWINAQCEGRANLPSHDRSICEFDALSHLSRDAYLKEFRKQK
jgi:hypothetical protein